MLVDLFPQRANLTIDGKNTFPTISGVLTTLLVFAASFFLIIDSFFNLIFQTNPTIVVESKVNDKFSVPFMKRLNNETYFVYLTNVNLGTLSTSRIFSGICPSIFVLNTKNLLTDVLLADMTSTGEWCRPNNNSLELNEENYTRVNSTSIFVAFGNNYEQLLDNGDNSVLLANMLYPKVILDVNSLHKPINAYLTDVKLPLSKDESSIYRITVIRETYIITGSKLFNENNNHVHENYPFNNIQSYGKLKKKDNLPYLLLAFEYDNSQIVTHIKYMNEQEFLSSFGGSLGLMMMLGTIINSVLGKLILITHLINSHFTLYDDQICGTVKPKLSSCDGELIHTRIQNVIKNQTKAETLDILLANYLPKRFKSTKIKQISKLCEILPTMTDIVALSKQIIVVKKILYLMFQNENIEDILSVQPYNISNSSFKSEVIERFMKQQSIRQTSDKLCLKYEPNASEQYSSNLKELIMTNW